MVLFQYTHYYDKHVDMKVNLSISQKQTNEDLCF